MQLPYSPALRSRSPRADAASTTAVARSASGSLRVAVLDQLDREHGAEPADVADAVEALAPRLHPLPDRLADPVRPLDEMLLVDHVEHCVRGCDRDRVADVRAADRAVAGRVHDLGPADHARERVAGRDGLGDRHQVRLDPELLDREHRPGTAEAGLHLVDDQHDPVLGGDLAHALDELLRRRDEAALALHRLEDDRRDLLGGDARLERAAQLGQRGLRVRPAVRVGERDAVDLRRERARGRPCTDASST